MDSGGGGESSKGKPGRKQAEAQACLPWATPDPLGRALPRLQLGENMVTSSDEVRRETAEGGYVSGWLSETQSAREAGLGSGREN